MVGQRNGACKFNHSKKLEATEKLPTSLLLALSGFAAFSILQPEDGLHILEIPEEEEKSFKRFRVQVRVVPQPDEPVGPGLEALRQQASYI